MASDACLKKGNRQLTPVLRGQRVRGIRCRLVLASRNCKCRHNGENEKFRMFHKKGCVTCSIFGIVAGQSSFGGFAVEARNVLAGFLHHLYHAVVADHVVAVREVGIAVGVERTGCGDGVALDAGDLHQSANRVARKSQVVFEAHSSAYRICEGVPPKSWQAAAAAMAQATPTSPWQPTSAPEIDELVLATLPNSPPVARARRMRRREKLRVFTR